MNTITLPIAIFKEIILRDGVLDGVKISEPLARILVPKDFQTVHTIEIDDSLVVELNHYDETYVLWDYRAWKGSYEHRQRLDAERENQREQERQKELEQERFDMWWS